MSYPKKVYSNTFRFKLKTRGSQYLRKLDTVFGRALVFFLRIFKVKRSFPRQVETIGVLKLTGIGDLILLSGVLRDIRLKYPSSKLVLFCGGDNQCLSSMIPSVDQVIALSVMHPFRSIGRLRKTNLSFLIDFGQWSRIEALFSFFSKAKYQIGFRTDGQQRHFLYDAICLHSSKVHEMENYRALIKRAKVDSRSQPSLILKQECCPPELEMLKHEKLVLFHPWPSGLLSHLKEWPLSHWVELGNAFLASGYHILLSGGQNEVGSNQKILLALQGDPRVHNLAGRLSLNQLGSLIQQARCVVSVNTGIMHFAACFTDRLVALHGPTSALRWGPLRRGATSISSKDPQSGYLNLGFEYPKNPIHCMESISVQRVLKACGKYRVFDC